MFCKSLEEKSFESNAADGCLAYEVSEGSKDSTGPLHEESGVYGQLELKNCLIKKGLESLR